jgi:molybdenum cofactor biosynthesis enzyme MoaA
MEQQIEATLTGTDSTIDGTVQAITYGNFTNAYEFKSIDETLHLIIAKEADGEWIRLTGTEPYLSSWIDELAEQIG